MTSSLDADKAFEKTQLPFMTKVSNKFGIKALSFNIKRLSLKTHSQCINECGINGNAFSKIWKKASVHFPLLFEKVL